MATALLHILAGGRFIAQPLLASTGLGEIPKYTNYYCWHIVSIVLLTMAVGYAYCGLDPQAVALAVVLTGLAASFALWSGLLIVWKKLNPLHMLQWMLFLPITLLGLAGLT